LGERPQDLLRSVENVDDVKFCDACKLLGIAAYLLESILAQPHSVEQRATSDNRQRDKDQNEDPCDDTHPGTLWWRITALSARGRIRSAETSQGKQLMFSAGVIDYLMNR
jgi:hypothetical protein